MAQQQQVEADTRPELSHDDIREMSDWFYFFDKNGDKKLDRDEMKRVFHAMCWSVDDKEMENIFKTADKDGDGLIDYDEYMSLLQSLRKDPHTERCELIEAFRHFDKDRSGYIDEKELRRFLLTLGLAFNDRDKRQMDTLIKQIDKNGDGKIDIEEFVDIMLEKPEAPSAKYFH
ncbi:uncharacterized protein LOC123540371 [Mercenaria mercenaria]|uniref:uncharacterized protein LOC123540371 n=1 Tax=Mercenaria mercenaria TaxID=6596 RepID=UPI001E1D4DC3|nr:uncharacterized protein LOC123540371 [Mercenaria mercenaria]